MSKNLIYTKSVEEGRYPKDNFVPIDDTFIDERGEISNLLLTKINSVARICSRAGSVRANHYHKTDWHYAFVESGEILYFERSVGSINIPLPVKYNSGQMFYTKPNVEHAMLFTKDTVFYTFATNIRNHENHESDVVRVSFITKDIVEKFVS